MRAITFDIETIGEFSGGLPDPSVLDIAVVGIHDSQTDAYRAFEVHELSALWPLLEQADMLIGYNSDHFDIPILNKYYSGDLTSLKSIDLLKEVKKSLGRRLRLDSLADATLGKRKSGDGLQAVRWWKEGKKDKVIAYCLDDVRITRELYDFARANGLLKYRDFDGIREVKLDTSSWETQGSGALTHTLPF